MKRKKVVIVGAGQVGATFAYALMLSALETDIVLIDQDRQLAEGHVMDLNHGLLFVQNSNIIAGSYEDCKGADIVVITAGANQKKGETRMDLIKQNAEIFKMIVPEIVKYRPEMLLVVTNPVDVLTYIALKISKYAPEKVIGSGTVLDTARFRYLLSRHCNVNPKNIHAYIIGEHGDSEVPVWSQANIAGIPMDQYCLQCSSPCNDLSKTYLFEKVKNVAYDIIQYKGATNYAIGLALVRILESVFLNENSVLTISTLVHDYYGVDDVCLSVPALVNENGVSRVLKLRLSKQEIERFIASADMIKAAIDKCSVM